MSRTEILIGGVGGQGVVLSGILLGTAATLFDGKKAVQTQSYSSELRGGSARAEVIISEEPVSDPQVRRPDILIVLAEDALPKYIGSIKPKGLLVIDSDLVKEAKPGDYEILSIPATSIADKEMGNIVVANLIILGALIKKTGLLSVEAMEKAIEVSVPKKATALNLDAFRRGLELIS
jgi:2-oxoglutarate ferredoxin oxidoreductase subunit gamma